MARKDSCVFEKPRRIERRTRITEHIAKVTVVLILIANVKGVECSQNSTSDSEHASGVDIAKKVKLIEAFSGRLFGKIYENGTFRTGNSLWDNILNQCTVNPSMSCLQKNFYTYLDDKLKYKGDVKLGSAVCFEKNNVDINKYTKEANIIYLTGSKIRANEERSFDEENEIDDEEESGKIIFYITKFM